MRIHGLRQAAVMGLVGALTAGIAGAASGTIPSTTLPQVQTMQKPSASDPALAARLASLFDAIKTGNNAEAIRSFLPVGAYVAIKQGGGNASDWQYRLIDHDFLPQLARIRASLGHALAQATYVGYSVPQATAHICPVGREENKAPYWQVYYTRLLFKMNGVLTTITINTMISWRGQWYPVHMIGFG